MALPFGSRLEWVGEFCNLQNAIARLSEIVPITISLITFLVIASFNTLLDEGRGRMAAIIEVAGLRMRPVLMTGMAATFSALSPSWSSTASCWRHCWSW